MEFKRLSAPSLKELLVCQIRDRILSGELPVGSQLPTERDLAQQMQVSRAVINSGLKELENQGFLEIIQRQGVYVADYGRNGNINTLTAIMEYHNEKLGHNEIRSILEVRRALEHLATDSVIANAPDSDIERLESLAQTVKDSHTISDITAATFAFHHELSVISSNSILPLIYISFKPVVTQLWFRFCNQYGVSALCDSTLLLYKCIRSRDAESARRCTDQFMDDAISGSHQIY